MSEELGASQYRAILESLPNGVYVVDTQQRIVFWNDGAEQITGHRRQDVMGRRCPETPLRHCDPNYINLCESGCPVQQTICDGRPRQAEIYVRHKNGQRVPVWVRVVPVHDESGILIGAAESFDERRPVWEAQLHAHAQKVENHRDARMGISDYNSVRCYLEACLADFAEDQAPLGVLSIAVDRLAAFRKAHGGQAAERVLCTVAGTLSKNLPREDILGLALDDRFVAILVDCPSAMLARVAERLQKIVNHTDIPWWGDRLAVTISLGGTAARAGDTGESLLSRSERALFASIENGGVEIV